MGDFGAYGSEKFQYAHLNSLVSFNCRNVNSIWSDISTMVFSKSEHDNNMHAALITYQEIFI